MPLIGMPLAIALGGGSANGKHERQVPESTLATPPDATQESERMCMNCGCGEADKRHQPTDITKEDLQRAAEGSGISLEEETANLRASLDTIESTSTASSQA